MRAEYAQARQPERRPRMVKMAIEIEAGTPTELDALFKKLSNSPAVEISGTELANMVNEARGIEPGSPSIINGVPADKR